jgi:integrase
MNDVLENREIINTKKAYEAVQNYQHMDRWYKELLDIFLEEISVKYEPGYIQGIRISASRFLIYASTHGVDVPSGITHKLVFDYHRDDMHRSQKVKDHYNGNVRFFLRYLADRKLVKSSIPLTLDKFVLNRLIFIEDLPANEKVLFHMDGETACMAAEKFHSMAVQLSNACMEKHRYSSTIRKNFLEAWDELFVFLEANGLDYSQNIALCWATYMQRHTTQWWTFRRAIKIFEQFRNSGNIDPAVVYSYGKDKAEDLSGWCQKEYRDFIAEKQREGFASSTIHMYRSSCLRFLGYLSHAGITAWESVFPEVVKNFHLSDPHSTPEARNAYGAKVRAFLEYLAGKVLVPSSLHLALSNEHAPRVNIIRTLNEDDLTAIYDFRDHAQTGIQLRNTALIMLGLRMGIRASDITKLRLSDISWDKVTISVQQEKTDKFIKLPMPTEVGNTLYRYIMHGRPSTASEYIFVKHRVPYDRLNSRVCANALKQALPNDPHGFHVTRKTFASRMLVNSIKPAIIAEALGHSDNSTVMTYLATDGRSMRKCAISLERIDVKGGILS